jgi:predicted nucleic acid-binding protein
VTVLFDANVLIGLLITNHIHHAAAEAWLAGGIERCATCPITQGSLTRLLLRSARPPGPPW